MNQITEEKIEDSTWGREDIKRLDEFEERRAIVLRATKKLFSDFYRSNFKGNEKVLEVGSGTGFLRRNWPDEFRGEWIQADSQPFFLEAARKKFPEGNYIQASAYELPFPDESLDVVCGYGSYDVLMNLEAGIKEAARVLKKGGLFFHMLDLFPCFAPITRDLENRKIPLRIKGCSGAEYDEIDSISFIPEGKIEDFHKKEMELPDEYNSIYFGKENKIWEKYSQEVKTHDYFSGQIINQLISGFELKSIESGKLTAMFRGERTENQKKKDSECFSFFHDAGRYMYYLNSTYYSIHQLKFPAMLNAIPLIHDTAYKMLDIISKPTAKRIEPLCTEISSVRYVKARK